MHTLGFVPTGAPNHHRAGHVSDDGIDLMWAGEGNWFPDGYASAVLDAGNDDYYGHSDGGCLDFSDSTFLIGNTDPDPTCPATVDVAVSGTSFTPKTATPVIGGCVEWHFNGPGNHMATEKKKLGPGTGPLRLRESGTGVHFHVHVRRVGWLQLPLDRRPHVDGGCREGPGEAVRRLGRRQHLDHRHVGIGEHRRLPIRRAAALQAGRCSYGAWGNWRSDQTGVSDTFLASAANGRGVYQFRAHFENATTAKVSGWSAGVTLKIT